MDTTVILAQPRVSRLRADAVYVDASGSGRAPPGKPEHHASVRFWEPKSLQKVSKKPPLDPPQTRVWPGVTGRGLGEGSGVLWGGFGEGFGVVG